VFTRVRRAILAGPILVLLAWLPLVAIALAVRITWDRRGVSVGVGHLVNLTVSDEAGRVRMESPMLASLSPWLLLPVLVVLAVLPLVRLVAHRRAPAPADPSAGLPADPSAGVPTDPAAGSRWQEPGTDRLAEPVPDWVGDRVPDWFAEPARVPADSHLVGSARRE
jgi:hypothetical protein